MKLRIRPAPSGISECPTGIRGLDEITDSGRPKVRPTLVRGTAAGREWRRIDLKPQVNMLARQPGQRPCDVEGFLEAVPGSTGPESSR